MFMKELIQERADIIGVKIIDMKLMEISYDESVASNLLQV